MELPWSDWEIPWAGIGAVLLGLGSALSGIAAIITARKKGSNETIPSTDSGTSDGHGERISGVDSA
jgi:hypothetical protein